jgi:hypothetical protein
MKHRLEQEWFGGSCGIDTAGVITNLHLATLNGDRVWVITKPGYPTEVFDDPVMAEAHYNHIRLLVKEKPNVYRR